MVRILVLATLACDLLLAGCAAPQRAAPASPAPNTAVASLRTDYQRATTPHRRGVRKPVRDQQALALQRLADKADALLAAGEPADSDVELAAHEEGQPAAAAGDVAAYRSALSDLRDAAAGADLAAVRTSYARLLTASRRLNSPAEPGP